MTKIFNFALKIKGSGREGGTCEVLRPCHPPQKKKFETCTSNKICPKKVYISEAEIAEKNNRTTSFGEKDLFICGHIYLCKQLLPPMNICYQEVMQNNEITSPWSNHCWMLVASRKRLPGSRVGFGFQVLGMCQTCPCTGWTTTFRINGWALRDVTSFFCILQSVSVDINLVV